MSKDKKQLLVVGILGLAMLAIGAFQFLAPKGPAAAGPEPKDAAIESDDGEVAVGDTAPPIDSRRKIIGELLGSVQPRDPFLAQAIILGPPPDGGGDGPIKVPGPTNPRPTVFDPGDTGPYDPMGNGTELPDGTLVCFCGRCCPKCKDRVP